MTPVSSANCSEPMDTASTATVTAHSSSGSGSGGGAESGSNMPSTVPALTQDPAQVVVVQDHVRRLQCQIVHG